MVWEFFLLCLCTSSAPYSQWRRQKSPCSRRKKTR